jgi:Na+/melibiose symporter-like transporter
VERSQLGIATATTTFFRALGGAVGAAALGAVFTARTGAATAPAHIADGVQTVFLVAAPLAAVGLLVLLWLPEAELKQQS